MVGLGDVKTCDHVGCTRKVRRYGKGFTFCTRVHRDKMDHLNKRAHVLGKPKVDVYASMEKMSVLLRLVDDEINTREYMALCLKERARGVYTNLPHQRRLDYLPFTKSTLESILEEAVDT